MTDLHTVIRRMGIGLLAVGVSSTPAWAQQAAAKKTAPVQPDFQRASAVSGRVTGLVRDDRGQGVGGVVISALGTTTATVTTDATGRFSMPLPSGEYLLRAHRDGYVSAYRDLVQVRPSQSIERTITVTRQPVSPGSRPVMLAGVAGASMIVPASSTTTVPSADPDHPHDTTQWYLRHLPRPVLRDLGGAVGEAVQASAPKRRNVNPWVDWALYSSARAATSFFTNTDFSGQVNFITTSAIDPSVGFSRPEVPRNVAYMSVSAPVGSVGDWRVRGAMNATDLSSWVLLGEFRARDDRSHAYAAGMSYSAQVYGDETAAVLSSVSGDTRTVGGVYANDHWTINKGLVLDYGARWDRYSYVTDASNMFSPSLSSRAHLVGRTSLVGQAAQRMVAPGSAEFLPPTTTGPWLPPERRFSSLSSTGVFRAERVRHYDFGVEQAFDGGRTLSVRRFREATADQAATIFGLSSDLTSGRGQYAVAAVGGVAIDGWAVRAAGMVSSWVTGSVEYTLGDSSWHPSGTALRRVLPVAPSAARTVDERFHDVRAAADLDIPQTDTRVSVVCRVNTQFSRGDADATPGLGARFDMQVNQALPFQPVRGGRLEVLVAVSNMLRDARQQGSYYDELLTVAPPLRLLGGFQIRF